MPTGAYFKGHGAEVLASMRAAHPGASAERIKAMFYATANKRHMKPSKQKRGSLLHGEKKG